MATTENFYTGNASTTSFGYSFPILQNSDLKVELDGVLKTENTSGTNNDYSISGTNVVFNSAPGSSVDIHIYRLTDVDSAKAVFAAGSSIRAGDLNNNVDQSLYADQEQQQKIKTSDIRDIAVTTAKIKDLNVTRAKIANDAIDGTKIADDSINSEHYVSGSIDLEHMSANSIDSDQYVDGSIDRVHLAADIVDGTKIADDSINSEHYVDASIDEQHIANSQVTSNKIADNAVGTTEIANGAVTRAKLEADAIDGTKLADNAVNSEHYTDGSIDRVHLSADIIDSTKLEDNAVNSEHYVDGSIDRVHLAADIVDGTKIADDSIDSEHIAAGALDNEHYAAGSITSDKLNGATVITSSEQGSATTNDTSFLTSAAADARFFNISSGDTIKDGQTFPDNDTTIATTAAINDRIIDIVNDVGGFDIVESEQHFPNTNPQGQAGSAAVLSIKAASTNLVPSGTTLTISNGNLANNANITITGVTSTIPSGFGFIVESTSTLHTYTFHRLVPKATEVTTVAGKATEIGRLGTAAAVEDMSILGTADAVADMAILGTNDVVADMNLLATSDVVSDMNTLAVADVLSDLSTVADSVTNVNNVGNNITNVNSVSNSAGANQTFTVTVQNVSGNKYFIDGVQTPVLKLARGKTYTFDMSDSSNSTHPLAFKDGSGNSYTTGVTTSGTAGSSGATVVIVVAANAPSSLRYYCTSHGNSMGNTITVIDDNVGTVAGSISNVNTVGGAISNVNTTAGSISNVNTVATNINDINDFTDKYRVGANNPTTGLDTGDLFFNTTSNSLKVYTGSAWVDGVTATGNFAVTTGNTFSGSNRYNDNVKAEFGTSADLEIFHTGAHGVIDETTGALFLKTGHAASGITLQNRAGNETMAVFLPDAQCQLHYDNNKKLETTSGGVTVTGSATISSGQPALYFVDTDHNPDFSIKNADGIFRIIDETNTTARFNVLANGTVDIAGNLDVYGGIDIPADNQKLQIGASQDLELFHDGSNTFITNNTGYFVISSENGATYNDANSHYFRTADSSEYMAKLIKDAAVELYYNNSKKFETFANGITVSSDNAQLEIESSSSGTSTAFGVFKGYRIVADVGRLAELQFINQRDNDVQAEIEVIANGDTNSYFDFKTSNAGLRSLRIHNTGTHLPDNFTANYGNSNDLQIYHDGTDSILLNNTNKLRHRSDNHIFKNNANSENLANFLANGAVKLYYDSGLKFETKSSGVGVTGTLDVGAIDSTVAGADNTLIIETTSSGDPKLQFNASGSGGHRIEYLRSSNILNFTNGSSNRLQITAAGHTIPGTDSLYDLGLTGTRWRNVYADTYYGDGSNLTGINTDLVSDTSPQLGGDLQSNGNDIDIADNDKAVFGTGGDLEIYHNTNINAFNLANGHNLDILYGSEYVARFSPNGNNELYYDNSKKFETNSGGVEVFGHLQLDDSKYLKLGNSGGTADVQIFHNGSNFHVQHTNAGSTYIDSVGDHYFRNSAGTEFRAQFKNNGAVDLYYDGTAKFNTDSYGTDFPSGYLHKYTSTGNSVELRFHTSDGTRRGSVYADNGNTVGFLTPSGGWSARWHSDGKQTSHGDIVPNVNGNYDLGSSSYRWGNVYTNDLHLSNKGSSNDMDGTWGDWTIQEGESDLFLKNNRSGKKYKFNITEVS